MALCVGYQVRKKKKEFLERDQSSFLSLYVKSSKSKKKKKVLNNCEYL